VDVVTAGRATGPPRARDRATNQDAGEDVATPEREEGKNVGTSGRRDVGTSAIWPAASARRHDGTSARRDVATSFSIDPIDGAIDSIDSTVGR